MAGVPGKNKLERGIRFYFDDSGGTPRELSGDMLPGTLQGGGVVLDEVDMSGASDAVKKALGGPGDGTVVAQFYLNDTATTGAHTVLKGMVGLIGTLTIQWGSNGAAPSTGDPEWEGEYVYLGGQMSASGKGIFSATFKPASGQADPAWGTVS
ncbi:MAG: hypothetical protein C4575_12945 [Desulforudis sp.]|nr:MAG: hypothetical protein C4575_12945 [Desulforudis sp.]